MNTSKHPLQPSAEPLRWDIQALRGLAVAWVLLHHAQLPGLGGGYLGVDIFFVISGYLITGQVQRALQDGRFSFRDFYARRARRLLPAAYVTLALTVLASPWLLNAREQLDLADQARGALLLASNWVLWQQSGYFQGAAELKPLLHFWSLSVEEQYYLLLPALLWLVPSRRRGLAVLALCIASFAVCMYWLTRDADLAFYALPSRAWEMGLGSLLALYPMQPRQHRIALLLRLAAAMALLLLPLIPAPGWPHPGPLALLVCLASAVLLQAPPQNLQAPRVWAPMVWLGDRSYALYLVHWPLMAAVNNAWVGTAHADDAPSALQAWRLAALGASLPLAWLMHRWVEQPGKLLLRGQRGWMALLLGSATLAVLPSLTQHWGRASDGIDHAHLARPNHGFGPHCDAERPFTDSSACQQGAPASWMVWGDSYAMHLVPGLAAHLGSQRQGLVQATKSSCGPFLDILPYRPDAAPGATFAPRWVQQCRAFNESVMDWLAQHPEVRTVVLSSLLVQYLDTRRYSPRITTPQGDLSEQMLSPEALQKTLIDDLRRTTQRLQAQGRQVIWVAPPPRADFNVAACLERRALGRWTLGAPPDCRIDSHPRDAASGAIQAWLDDAQHVLPVLRFEPLLCRNGACDVMQHGVMLYRDQGHLSVAGSVQLMPELDWPPTPDRQP